MLKTSEPSSQQNSFSSYIFSMERSGSSMLWDITREILRHAGRPYSEPFEDLFERGISHNNADTAEIVSAMCVDGCTFGVIRNPHGIITNPFIAERPILIFVRDPRDVIVSLYFSLFSHRTSGASVDDEFSKVRRRAGRGPAEFAKTNIVNGLLDRYALYAEFASAHPNARVLHYEDFVYRKADLAAVIADFLGVSLDGGTLARIAARNDSFPSRENPAEHIRSVVPGNYSRHLDEASLRIVEESFAEVMAAFGYPPESFVPFGYGEKGARMVPELARRRRELFATIHQMAAYDRECGTALLAANGF